MSNPTLRDRLRQVRRRLVWIGSTTGAVWGLAAAILLLVAGVWLDLLWELSPQWRIAALAVAGCGGLVLVGILVGMTVRAGRDALLARRLDRAARSGGEILTGLELDESLPEPPRGAPPAVLSAGLARMAVEHATGLAAKVPSARAVPARPLGRSLGGLLGLAAVVGLLALCLPGLARTQWDRFTRPYGDVPPYSQTELVVEPGDVELPYGSELDIHVTAQGDPVDRVELVLAWKKGGEEVVPMFLEPDGRWRAVLAKVTEPAVYFARAYRARSPHYELRVITVPRIEEVKLRITPPAYTGQAPYEGPMPKEGIAGLPGTEVRITATSNRPLGGGRVAIRFGRGAENDARGGIANPSHGQRQVRGIANPSGREGPDGCDVAMQPTGGENEVAGHFEITRDGKFELRVIDTDGQESQEVFAGTITVLSDQHPFVRLLQPRAKSLATPRASLPVVISAEDDYGVSRVQLYRSLNDSRALPMEVRVAKRAPRRVYETVLLPLDGYGLMPGDVVKLFGRVEDNDPAGAKGSESSMVEVQIISQEDFERLLQVREGMKVLLSKYREARRRMEGLSQETRGLRKKMKDSPEDFLPRDKVSQETRQRLRRLSKRLRDEANQLRQSAAHKLPYDVDSALAGELEQLAKVNEQLAKELEEMLDEAGLNNERVAKMLEEMTNRLATERKEFDRKAMEPLEHLEKIFPLIADQSRFIVLVLRQKDLAERLASLKGRDAEDNPALKARMRDLEEEQRKVREDLGALLDDIENHVARLPEDPKLDRLRETAGKFVKDVRASGAAEAMAEAEAGLAEFSGTKGYEKAKEAADILSRFVKDCSGMGNCAGDSLVFQPSLGACLGNTVAQMLAQMGLPGSGSGFGMGTGAGSGFSAQRGLGQDIGLYGSLPGMTDAFEAGSGRDESNPDGPGGSLAGRANPDEPSLVESPAGGSAGGVGEGGVPIRYRRRVGQYFQRIAEEAGQR